MAQVVRVCVLYSTYLCMHPRCCCMNTCVVSLSLPWHGPPFSYPSQRPMAIGVVASKKNSCVFFLLCLYLFLGCCVLVFIVVIALCAHACEWCKTELHNFADHTLLRLPPEIDTQMPIFFLCLERFQRSSFEDVYI